ncbi:NAD(P)H-hydrate dehydratase [Aquabacterium sp. J223]|uniref:NAD(P)H-hydrate dehydratase n=1 Tax=Aquabacterium sp. J223 TaxID=2898431 RepID=UPI0021ADD05B|nr:NAD(P)H-hydrate dehydratase [Aquabacterium sp. J223]
MRAPQGPSATPAAKVDDDLLRQWPLPQPDGAADKEARGRVLIVGGSTELPGGVVLAAEAALRAGAGKVAVATVRSAAPFVAAALPEARVVALDEDGQGRLAIHAAERLRPLLARTAALLVGPGMPTDDAVLPLVDGLLQALADEATVVLDAAAMVPVARGRVGARRGPATVAA